MRVPARCLQMQQKLLLAASTALKVGFAATLPGGCITAAGSYLAGAAARPASSAAPCCGHSCWSQSATAALSVGASDAPCRCPLSCSSPSSCGKLKIGGLFSDSAHRHTSSCSVDNAAQVGRISAHWHCAHLGRAGASRSAPGRRQRLPLRGWLSVQESAACRLFLPGIARACL